MTRRIRLWNLSHLVLLIAAALVMRAVVPQGYMVEQEAGGGIAVSLCNAQGAWVIPMRDGAGKPEAPDEADQTAKVCAFASLHDSGTPANDYTRLALPQLAAAVFDSVRARALSPTSAAQVPPPTGPPLTV